MCRLTDSASSYHGHNEGAMITVMSGKSAATSSLWIGFESFSLRPPPGVPAPMPEGPPEKIAGGLRPAITS